MGQVPGRDVVFGLAHDRDVVEKRRCQVDPALIGEEAVRDLVIAELPQPIGPPVDEAASLPGRPHRQETQVINAVPQAADLVIEDRLRIGLGLDQVRRQEDAVAIEFPLEAVEPPRAPRCRGRSSRCARHRIGRRCTETPSP